MISMIKHEKIYATLTMSNLWQIKFSVFLEIVNMMHMHGKNQLSKNIDMLVGLHLTRFYFRKPLD